MLQIENASIAYGNDILFSGFNLQLERGEIASISGPSGCGKSSLLNAILGFTPLKEGRIVLNGILLDKGNVDVVRKQTAWIPQELALPLEWVKDIFEYIRNNGLKCAVHPFLKPAYLHVSRIWVWSGSYITNG